MAITRDRLGANQWKEMEKPSPQQEQQTIHMIYQEGAMVYKNIKTNATLHDKTLGEQKLSTDQYDPSEIINILYGEFRPQLIKVVRQLVTTNVSKSLVLSFEKLTIVNAQSIVQSSKSKKSSLKKQDVIRLQSTIQKVKKSVAEILSNNSTKPSTIYYIFEYKLLQYIKWAIKSTVKFLQEPNEQENGYIAYEALVSLKRCMEHYQLCISSLITRYNDSIESNASTTSKTSKASKASMTSKASKARNSTCSIMDDLHILCDTKMILNACKKAIEFDVRTIIDKYERLITKTHYESHYQTSILKPYQHQKHVLELVKNHDKVLILYRAETGGGKTLTTIGIMGMVHNRKKVIFCCSSDPVCFQVGKMAHSCGILFAMMTDGRLTKHWNCKKLGKEPELIISDIVSCKQLLTDFEQQNQQVILILDEPTINADNADYINETTIKQVEIMMSSPYCTIWCSATMPERHQLNLIIDHVLRKNSMTPEDVHDVTSTKVGIPAALVSSPGRVVMPHHGVQSNEELQQRLHNIKINPGLLKFYSGKAVATMMASLEINNVEYPTCNDYFTHHQLNNDTLRSYAISLLDFILNNDFTNHELTSICQPSTKPQYPPLNVQQMFTKDAFTFMGGTTLIVDQHPVELAEQYCTEQLSDMDKIDTFMKRLDVQEKERSMAVDRINKLKNEDERSRMIDQLEPPTMQIPEKFRVNSMCHYQRFNKKPLADKTMLQQKPPDYEFKTLNNIPVAEWVKKLLIAGIGIYAPGSDALNPRNDMSYTFKVIQLLTNGYLSFIIADKSFIFGTNFPIAHVVITETFSKQHSSSTIRQLIGRAGRVGKSLMASIRCQHVSAIDKLFQGSLDQYEALNMVHHATIIKHGHNMATVIQKAWKQYSTHCTNATI